MNYRLNLCSVIIIEFQGITVSTIFMSNYINNHYKNIDNQTAIISKKKFKKPNI